MKSRHLVLAFFLLPSLGFSSTIVNTILWNNSAPTGPEIWIGDQYYPSTLSISYSDVEGGQSSVHIDPNCILDWGPGMIDADPLFIDSGRSDFHIPFDSPCRSAGDRNAAALPDRDFEGDPRTGLFVFPDLGADEFHTRFYVNGWVSSGSSVTGVLPSPDPTPFGNLWLIPPWNHRVHFNAMPDNGLRRIERTVSNGLPPGTDVPFQALVGTELSNLQIVTIE